MPVADQRLFVVIPLRHIRDRIGEACKEVGDLSRNLRLAVMRRIAIADGDAFGKIEGIVEASLARSGAFNG